MPVKKPLILLINGPNLNLLGKRETDIYGEKSLKDINSMLESRARELGVEIEQKQSNYEGQLIEWLHEAPDRNAKAVLLNAAALTHCSIGLYDAIKAIDVPVIEVHLSNPHAREAFRRTNFISPVARGTISGFGAHSYLLALDAALRV